MLKRLHAIIAGKTPSELRERVKVFEALRAAQAYRQSDTTTLEQLSADVTDQG